MLGLLLVIRSLISMTLDALQHFSDAGFPFFLLVPGIGTDPDGRWLRLRHVRSPECVAPIFYRILLWRIKLGKSLTSSSVFVGAKRAPFAVGVAGTGAAVGERRAIWRTSLALVLLQPLRGFR
jgi:hypothetical protein